MLAGSDATPLAMGRFMGMVRRNTRLDAGPSFYFCKENWEYLILPGAYDIMPVGQKRIRPKSKAKSESPRRCDLLGDSCHLRLTKPLGWAAVTSLCPATCRCNSLQYLPIQRWQKRIPNPKRSPPFCWRCAAAKF